MQRIKHDCKGSTLIILLLTISIIVLIGTIALSLAVMNYKMKNLNSELKKTFYLAEAGIEEAYIITHEFVNEAIDYAISKAEEFEAAERLNNINFENMQYILNNAIIEEKLDIVFSGAFKNFIKGNCIDISSNDGLIVKLKENSSYVVYKNGYPKIDPIITESKESFLVEVKSTYVRENIKKIIIMKYSIDIPNYNSCIIDDEFNSEDIIKNNEWKIER